MKKIIKYIIALIVCCLSLYLIKIINDLGVLPNKYFFSFIGIILVLNIIADFCLLRKGIIKKIFTILIYLILIVLFIGGNYYGNETIKFLNKAFNNNTVELNTYELYVLKSSNYKELSDLENKTIGYIDEYDDEEIKNIKHENKKYDDIYEIYQDLINKKIDAFIIDSAFIIELEEENKDFNDLVKSIYSFEIKNVIKKENEEKITKLEPFNIYLSGSDSRSNKIQNKSRSDVNMILTINPDTKKVLLTSIPRDYYVNVHGKTGLKDKLTHSGIYGLDTSRQTVEDLFDINIAYSIKIGMPAVVEVVDLVGGVDIISDKEFNSYHYPGWVVKKGVNHMDGAHALAYSRERYAYSSGDRHRVLNQQQVLEAVLKKVTTDKSLLLKYDKLLESLSNLYRTDIPAEIITLLVKNQIDDMSSWEFITQSVSGSDASLPTYTAPNSKRYVMIPYDKDVTRAHDKITEVLNEK